MPFLAPEAIITLVYGLIDVFIQLIHLYLSWNHHRQSAVCASLFGHLSSREVPIVQSVADFQQRLERALSTALRRDEGAFEVTMTKTQLQMGISDRSSQEQAV